MGKFVKGDVVVLPFPFSDLSSSKRRPAFVVAIASSEDIVLAQITSRNFSDHYSIELSDKDFSEGGLSIASNIRPVVALLRDLTNKPLKPVILLYLSLKFP